MKHLNKGILLLVLGLFISGCSIGANQSKCEAEGCNYKRAGICMDSYDVLSNKSKASKLAYRNVSCNQR